jgi:hypothetical protein
LELCARPAHDSFFQFRFDLVESRDPLDLGERIQKLGDFQFTASQHGLAVAEQQHVKVVIERPVGVSRTPREDVGKDFAHGAENVADAEGMR